MKSFAFALLLITASFARAVDPVQTFANVNDAYASGDYAKARTGYEALVRQGDYGVNVFYNLGNAAWRLGDAGAAAQSFRRALAIDPHHPEAADNLRLVREKSHAQIFASSPWSAAFPALSDRSLFGGAIIFLWLFVLSLTAFFLRLAPPTGGWLAIGAFVLAAYSAAGWWQAERDLKGAIVVARQVEARFAPLDNSALAATLPAASEVRILQTGGPWTYCLLPNQQRAWIPSSALAPLRPVVGS